MSEHREKPLHTHHPTQQSSNIQLEEQENKRIFRLKWDFNLRLLNLCWDIGFNLWQTSIVYIVNSLWTASHHISTLNNLLVKNFKKHKVHWREKLCCENSAWMKCMLCKSYKSSRSLIFFLILAQRCPNMTLLWYSVKMWSESLPVHVSHQNITDFLPQWQSLFLSIFKTSLGSPRPVTSSHNGRLV